MTDEELAKLIAETQPAVGGSGPPEGAPLVAQPEFTPDGEVVDWPTVAPKPAALPDPGLASTLGRQLLQGFFKGGSDEAVGALSSAVQSPDPGAYLRMLVGPERQMGTSGDVYRATRDLERQQLEAARQNRPFLSFGAQVAGDIGSDVVANALGVPGVGSQPYNIATGALSGLLGSEAELTGPESGAGTVASALGSAGLGAFLGYAAPKLLGWAAKPAAPYIARGAGLAGEALRRLGIDRGRRALLSGADSLSVNRAPVADEAVEEALKSGAILPGGTAQGAAERLEKLAAERGDAYAAIVQRAEALGVKGPDAEALAERLMERYYAEEPSRMLTSNIDPYMEAAERILKLGQGAKGGRLGFEQIENLKRDLQQAVKYGRLEDTPKNETLAEAASILRESAEKELEAAAKTSAKVGPTRKTEAARKKHEEIVQLGEEFVPIKQQLGRTLEARAAARRGATRSANRGSSGLIDEVAQVGSELPWYLKIPAKEFNRSMRERIPSTVASGAYFGGQAARAVGRGLERNPEAFGDVVGQLARYGAQVPLRGVISPEMLVPVGEERMAELRAKAKALKDEKKGKKE